MIKVPGEVIKAVQIVGQWFANQNQKVWKLGDVASRDMAERWEEENRVMRARLDAMPIAQPHKKPPMTIVQLEWNLGLVADSQCLSWDAKAAAKFANELVRSFRAANDIPWETPAADLHSLAQTKANERSTYTGEYADFAHRISLGNTHEPKEPA